MDTNINDVEETVDLLIDEEYRPILTEDECKKLKPIITDFINCYIKHKDSPVEKWLGQRIQLYLPELTPDEIKKITEEIVSSIKISEQKKLELNQHISQGRDSETWFADEIQKAASASSVHNTAEYLSGLDSAIFRTNSELYSTITTKAGNISQNPCLDGFIAEQYHAQTFNLNAEATGSPYRAKVLTPDGKGFAKNSVDIEIVDGNNHVVRKYQSKYYKDAKATEAAFKAGDYRGQSKLVPEGQQDKIGKKCSTVIEAPDGTKSNPLSKENAQKLRDEAQSGNWNDFNWDKYKAKDLAKGIGKQAGFAALQGAAIGVGFDIAHKLWNGEEVKGEEVVQTALISGADFGVKAAAAGALKVGVEKEIIKTIPKGTPASTLADIAFVAIENAKVCWKVIKGDLSLREGYEEIKMTTVSTIAGMAAREKGSIIGEKIGKAIGTVFGVPGRAIGSFIGATVGYMAGSKFGQAVVKGARKFKEKAKEAIVKIKDKVKEKASDIYNWVTNKFSMLFA